MSVFKPTTRMTGFTIIELLVVLVIGGVVLAWAGSKASEVWQSQKINTFVDDVHSINVAVQEAVGISGNYANVATTNLQSFLPQRLRNSSPPTNGSSISTSPWGSAYTLAPTSSNNGYTVSTQNIPTSVADRINVRFPNNATFAGGTYTITIQP